MAESLIAPQLLLEHLLDASADTAIAVVDAAFRIRYLNPAAVAFFHCPPEAVLGHSVRDLHIKNEVAAKRFDEAVALIRQGKCFEYRVEQPDGDRIRHLGMHLSGLWEHRLLIGYLLLGRDITERRQAEIHLAERERHYRSLYEQAPVPYHSLDAHACIREVNRAWLETFGYAKDAVVGHCIAEFVVSPSGEAFARAFERFKRQGRVSGIEMEMRHARGHVLLVLSSGSAVYDGAGLFEHTQCILTDVTAQRQAESARWLSEVRYRTLVETVPYGIQEIDVTGKILFANSAYHRMLGYSTGELIGRSVWELIPDDDERERLRAFLARAANEQLAPATFQNTNRRRDDSIIDLQVDWDYRRNEEGNVLGFIAVITDITERNKAQRALQESERLLSEAQRQAHLGSWLWEIASGRVRWSDETYRILGLEPQSQPMTFKKALRFVLPADRERVKGLLRDAMEQGGAYKLEFAVVRPDGGERVVYGYGEADCDSAGSVVRLTGTIQDITEQVSIRRELEQARFALDHAGDAVFWLRQDARFAYVNDAACRSLGYRREELLNMGVPDIDPLFPASAIDETWRRIRDEGTVRMESLHRRRDGSEFPVEIIANYLLHDGCEYTCAIVRDITESKRIQAELRQAHKMEALGQLTGGIAHDFNNILASILGFSELGLLRMQPAGDEKLQDYLEEIRTAGRRGRELVEQMLRFSRAGRNERQPLQLQPLLKEVARLLGATLPSSISIDLKCAGEVPSILGDPVQIHQALVNLCVNARDAMAGKGAIGIQLKLLDDFEGECSACHRKANGQWVELAVSDTGPGIPGELLERIFDPFFTTKEVGKGTGMGLAVVHGVLLEHEAHVVVETGNRGSRFRLLFPPLESGQRRSEAKPSCELPDAESLCGRILLVDDEPSVLKVVYNTLADSGLELLAFEHSLEALSAFSRAPDTFDLLVCDQTMPGLTGVELIREVRRIRPELPVILCTGYSEVLGADMPDNDGISRFLRKPVERKTLYRAVRELLGQ